MGAHESFLSDRIRAAVTGTHKATLHRVPSGVGLMERSGHHVRFGFGDGCPDLVGWIHGTGRLFGVEVKTPIGRLRPNQRAWIEWANATGAYACVARDEKEALAHLEAACRGDAGPALPAPRRRKPQVPIQ